MLIRWQEVNHSWQLQLGGTNFLRAEARPMPLDLLPVHIDTKCGIQETGPHLLIVWELGGSNRWIRFPGPNGPVQLNNLVQFPQTTSELSRRVRFTLSKHLLWGYDGLHYAVSCICVQHSAAWVTLINYSGRAPGIQPWILATCLTLMVVYDELMMAIRYDVPRKWWWP